jgi:hypothetical protein
MLQVGATGIEEERMLKLMDVFRKLFFANSSQIDCILLLVKRQ